MDKLGGQFCILDSKYHTHCGELTQSSQKVICSLFQPKPEISGYSLPSDAYDKYFIKPDESRLLSDEERLGVYMHPTTFSYEYEENLCKAQRDLTASIKDAEFDVKIRNEIARQTHKRAALREYYYNKLTDERAKTLKEVGELLDIKLNDYRYVKRVGTFVGIIEKMIMALKKGEMPNV